MFWARQKVHSWGHLHSIYNCQKAAHQSLPGEERVEVGFIWENASTVLANEYSRQGKARTQSVSIWQCRQGFRESRIPYNSSHFQVQNVGKIFPCDTGHTHTHIANLKKRHKDFAYLCYSQVRTLFPFLPIHWICEDQSGRQTWKPDSMLLDWDQYMSAETLIQKLNDNSLYLVTYRIMIRKTQV